MQIKELFGEDRAVSPVIGVILMVAITVILAAVIGTFVLGLGDRVSQSTPSASFSFDYTNNDPTPNENDTLEISHSGGDTITGSNLNASVSGAVTNNTSSTASIDQDVFTGDVSAGSTVTLDGSQFSSVAPNDVLELDSATVRVIWSGEGGDSSAVLGSWDGPNA